MSHFYQTDNFLSSIQEIKLILNLINDQNHAARAAILKSSVVLMVGKFQVFIEDLLSDIKYKIEKEELTIKNSDFLNLISLRLLVDEMNLNKKLENKKKYNLTLLEEIGDDIKSLSVHCTNTSQCHPSVKFKTKFRLGHTGVKELKKIFEQFEGIENIFADSAIDIDKMNSLLHARHNVAHQDDATNLTENMIFEYIEYISATANCIDKYISSLIVKLDNTPVESVMNEPDEACDS